MGISGPSTSIRALSIARPERAAIRCSTVPIRAEAMAGIGQRGAQTCVDHVLKARRDHTAKVGAAENDAVIDSGGPDGQRHAPPRVDADTHAIDRRFQCSLPTTRQDPPMRRPVRQAAVWQSHPSSESCPARA